MEYFRIGKCGGKFGQFFASRTVIVEVVMSLYYQHFCFVVNGIVGHSPLETNCGY